jgi:hypothetical protein
MPGEGWLTANHTNHTNIREIRAIRGSRKPSLVAGRSVRRIQDGGNHR